MKRRWGGGGRVEEEIFESIQIRLTEILRNLAIFILRQSDKGARSENNNHIFYLLTRCL